MNRWAIKFTLILIILTLCVLPLAGCWSRHELNDISIVVGMGIDKQKDRYQVSVQIVNPSQVTAKKSGGSFSPVVTYQSSGVTIPDALARMTTKTARELYLSHLRILVIGEEIARSGVSKPLDFISRNREMRTDFYLVVARNASAAQILSMYSPIDPIPANSLFTKLENENNTWAATGKVTLDLLVQELSKQGKAPALTTIEIMGKREAGSNLTSAQELIPPVVLKYDGMAAFQYDRMVGWMDEDDARVLNLIQNSTRQTTIVVPCPAGKDMFTVQLMRSQSRIHVTSPDEFEVVLHTEQDIADMGCEVDITKEETLDQLNKLIDERLESLIDHSIRKMQTQIKVDVFGFGDVLHRQKPKAWHEIKDWNKTFEHVKIRIRSISIIKRIGTTIKPIKDEIVK